MIRHCLTCGIALLLAVPSAQAAQNAARSVLSVAEPVQQIIEDLKAGRRGDDVRGRIAAYSKPARLKESHWMMEQIRQGGLLDAFLAATLRVEGGAPVPDEVRAAVRRVLESGRLDSYAETLATIQFKVFDPAVEMSSYGGAYGNGKVFVNKNTMKDTQGLANIFAHEIFHAFNDVHGIDSKRPGVYESLNEGFGIAAREYAFTPADKKFNIAEMVYGTMNFYRDISGNKDYRLGDAKNADPELRELMSAMAARDLSGLAWDNPTQLQDEYDRFFKPINRQQAFNTWLQEVEVATQKMVAARAK